MIDTDKYEGHTPAPWKAHNDFYKNGIDENNLGEVSSFRKTWGVTLSEEKLSDYRANRIGYHVMHIADAKLIADAPLILDAYKEKCEEVKRLREENELLRQGIIDACSTASSGAKRPVADGSIKHYFPLYLREMIE
tara:strand:+ start:222 stop:629 length:408 start_codon:yes stop_codon:yes gene_type:complete